jgi:hypothetical protein
VKPANQPRIALLRTSGISTALSDGPAAIVATATVCANGMTSGRHTVPARGTLLVSRYLLTLASMQADWNSEVCPQPSR